MLRDELIGAKKLLGQKPRVATEEFAAELLEQMERVRANPVRWQRLADEAALRSTGNEDTAAIAVCGRSAGSQPHGTAEEGNRALGVDLTGLSSAKPSGGEGPGDLRCPVEASLRQCRQCPTALSVGKMKAVLCNHAGKRVMPLAARVQEFRDTHVRLATSTAKFVGRLPRAPRWKPTPEGAGQAEFCNLLERRLRTFLNMCLPNGIAKVHSSNLMLKFDVFYTCDPGESDEASDGADDAAPDRIATHWFYAASGNDNAGAVPFRMNFVKLDNCDGESPDLFTATR